MSATPQTLPQILGELRVDIDRIDANIHQLLIERSAIIDRLIAVKEKQGGGSAFRPGREAEMMRRLAERHKGLLPLDTIEGIWRIIISTFTYVQSNYSVHADVAGAEPAMRDSARFHFGYTVPYMQHQSPLEVINAVAAASGDLGMIRIHGDASRGAWWTALSAPTAPKIIARLPFVERPDHPAGTPVYVIARPLAEAAAREIVLYSLKVERWRDEIRTALKSLTGEVIVQAAQGVGLSLLISVPGSVDLQTLDQTLRELDLGDLQILEAGSHAPRFNFGSREKA